MKRVFLVTVILALFGIFVNAQPQGLLGTWKATTVEILDDGEVVMTLNTSESGMDMKFTFESNGAAFGEVDMKGEKDSQKHTYKLSGSNIMVTDESGVTVSFTYSNGKLYLMMHEAGMDMRVNFNKQQ